MLTGGALTNSTWSTTNTFKRDKEKYIAALMKCDRQYNTFTVHFEDVSISNVKVEYLMLLPISAIMEYIVYHGVSYIDIPWTFIHSKRRTVADEPLQGLLGIPTDTKLPLHDWVRYLTDLVRYLHSAMKTEEGYKIMYEQYTAKEYVTMTDRDAGVFVDAHFPVESKKLKDDKSKQSLLKRAAAFAYEDKTIGDISEKCTQKWLLFIYFILKRRFPTRNESGYNENDVIQSVLDTNINWLELGEMEEAPNIRHLLTSPAHLMWSYLKENRRARTLYGDLVDKASIGIHRLMIIGVLIHWYMEKVGASDIDGAITSCELNFALWAKGALQSGQDSQPRFYSEFIPIYTEENVLKGVTAIIEAGVPVAVIPPRNVIHQNMTSDEYHSYYTEQMKVHRQGTREYELGHFNRRSRHEQNLAEGTCLFPPQSGHMSDWSQVDKAGYMYMEGVRMVGLVKKVFGQPVQSSSNRMIPLTRNPPMTAWNPPVTPRQATQAEIHEALCTRPANPTSSTPHQPKVITLGQLQANRTMQLEKNQFSAYIASNDYLVGWSNYTAVESEYLGRMGFHTIHEGPLHVGDNIVLLSREKQNPNQTMKPSCT